MVPITLKLMKIFIGLCYFCNAIDTVIKEITVNYEAIIIFNSDNCRLSKQCWEIILFLQQGGSTVLK